ncbi:hypothetical protein PTTG_29030, partial [Puccinia triticina 1-1 BBBD Race 1]
SVRAVWLSVQADRKTRRLPGPTFSPLSSGHFDYHHQDPSSAASPSIIVPRNYILSQFPLKQSVTGSFFQPPHSVSDRHNFKSFMLDKAKHTPVQRKLSGSDTPSSLLKRSRLETSTTKHHFAFSGYILKNFSHHDLAIRPEVFDEMRHG